MDVLTANEGTSLPMKITYTVTEVAELLGISRSSAYRCVRRGEIPSLTLGRRVVIPRRAFEALLDGARFPETQERAGHVVASTSVSTPLGAARRVDSHSGLERRRGATVAAVRAAGTRRGPSLDHDRATESRCRRSCRRDYTVTIVLRPATHHRRFESVPVVVAKINATASLPSCVRAARFPRVSGSTQTCR